VSVVDDGDGNCSNACQTSPST